MGMNLEKALTLPDVGALLAAPVGSIFVYRRELLFAPVPLFFAVVKLGADRWVRTQSDESLERALEAIATDFVATGHTRLVDDVDSSAMSKRLTASEVDADGEAPHVGLFAGHLERVPVREALIRADLGTIRAAREAAATRAGRAALEQALARFTPGRGATRQELELLSELVGHVPVDLAQLLSWSNGHEALELMSIDELTDALDAFEEGTFLPLNRNENGDHWGMALTGPAKGALVWAEADVADPLADDLVAVSLLAWLEARG